MEEAFPGVPGAYPGTPADESGPTPSRAPRHHHTSHGDHRHEHHEHTKPHKTNEPHRHRHADSGVGLVESQPVYPSSIDDETKPRAFSENTPAQSALAYEPQHTSSSHKSNDTHATRHDEAVEPVQEPVRAQGILETPKEADDKTDSKTDSKTSDNKTNSTSANPPYWGDLPKAIRGGIYNTVMGHGSPGDDHAQHHGLPQRSAPDRGHVTGPTTELHSGGVYNTVAGHGSQDEESKRHAATHPHLATEAPVSQPGAEIPLTAPLPKITREKDKTSDHTATETGRSDIARGFLPETALRDDVALAEAAGMTYTFRQEPPRSSAARHSRNKSLHSSTDFSATHRAFPLRSSPDRTQRRSQDVSAPEEQQQSTEFHGKRDAMAMAAGAGAIGAAVTDSERKDKPNKLRKQEPSPIRKSKQRSMEETVDKTDKIVTTSPPLRRSHDKGPTRPERTSSEEASSASEKKHHSILGIFHRRKDSKGEKDAKRSDKDVVEPKSDEQSRHSRHKKGEVTVAAAAGSGTHGLFHRHKDDEQKPKDQRSTSVPAARRSEETKSRSRRMSANQSAAAAAAESAGAFGVFYQKPQEKDIYERQDRGVDISKPPVPPERSPKRRSMTPPSSTAFAAENAHAPSTAQGSQSDSAVQSHDNSAKYAAAGVAAGLGASVFANEHDESNRSGLTQPHNGSTLPNFENPRGSPSTPADALTSKSRQSEVSPVKPHKSLSPQTSEAVANEPGHYNTPPSEIASGVRSSAGDNHLPSGTASGTKPRVSSGSDDESGLYNVLPSGTPSGVRIRSKETAFSKHGEDHHSTLPVQAETEPQAAKHSFVAAPIPLRHKEKREELTAHPHPEQAHNMSPEVLPDSYRAQSHPVPITDRNIDARAQKAQEVIMSPEVLPDSYRAQSHAVPGAERDPVPARSHASAVDPALAAATGAWAGKTADGSVGASGQGRVMHKCEFCGHDNDISSQFTKENMAKMAKNQGSTGNWWQDAWSSA